MRIINKILKLVFLLAIAIMLLGVGFTFLYGEKIEQIILSKIREKSEAEIKVKEVNFSVFENTLFPKQVTQKVHDHDWSENSCTKSQWN